MTGTHGPCRCLVPLRPPRKTCVRGKRETNVGRSLVRCDMMPGQLPDPSLTAGSLPSLGPLAGIPATTLTDQLKFADLQALGGMEEDEERRKRRREKNKVAAARCRNKKKERTDFLQRESERLEVLNSDLKAQIEELKQERQQLIVMLNRHRPTCIVRTDSVKTPESEANPLLEQLEAK
ncbi:hypothetical protein JZ751_010516 [Albula glossodonta]|uniref:BZIP domain-containing protein n=1 Tax=Albula glossodonta TaxID=121402 RepID=A0A8T2P873_9TELE|nr:hypothetical protein JZ751_010516 [Albula glossodonta]